VKDFCLLEADRWPPGIRKYLAVEAQSGSCPYGSLDRLRWGFSANSAVTWL
jgi:hypothetical protein